MRIPLHPANPTLLLLHGLPTSSRMFRNLIPALADRFHLVAPDYPGFGHSAFPPADEFEYSFANLTNVVERFIEPVGLGRFSLYIQDYGAPIGLDTLGFDRPRNRDIQVRLFYDYRLNLDKYPALQQYFRDQQPPTLIVWGQNDEIFGPDGTRAYHATFPTPSCSCSTPATSPSRRSSPSSPSASASSSPATSPRVER
jgi:pimeloyl-ACP methyl ester carboxylesterase